MVCYAGGLRGYTSQVVGKNQQLLACTVNEYAGNRTDRKFDTRLNSHSDTDIRRRRMIFRLCMTEFLTCTISCHSILSLMKQWRTRLRYVILMQSGCEPRWQVHLCDLRITNSTTKANQARMKPTTTVTYSRSSPALIKCQVFYSKDTVKIGGVSIADYTFAAVTNVSVQDNTNACKGMSSISFEHRTLKSRGDYERRALWSRVGVSRTPVFYPVSACVSRYLFSFMHSAQLMFDGRSHYTAFWQGWLKAGEPRVRV